jgi:glycosyltransferase involved in cell wall biosynthesis
MVLKPFDVGKLSEAIGLLIEDEALRKKMGDAGREFAAGRFDTQVMVQALDRLYREAGSSAP